MKDFRESIGLSQQALADYLGIQRSNLAGAEQSRREIPTSALIKLGQLELASLAITPDELKADEFAATSVKKSLRQHAALCLRKAARYEEKWREMEQEFERHRRKLGVMKRLREGSPIVSDYDNKWIEMQEALSQFALAEETLTEAAMLKFKAERLAHEAAEAIKRAG
jgi:transcriptional regulator with XRE-family HTH domain